MGLANWWLSRSAESSAASDKAKLSSMASSPSASSSSKSSVFKWPLKRAKSEPRKTQTQHHAHLRLRAVANAVAAFKPSPASPRTQPPPANPLFPEPSTESSESMLSCRLMNLRGLSAGVSQAKDLLQQCASVVSLYPSLVQLTVPCASTSEEPLTKPVASVVVVDEQQPVSEPEPATTPVFWVASEPLLRFENRIQSLVAKQTLETRLTSDGCGGVYFLQDASAPDATAFAVFKPRDEEYMAPKNPRGYVKENAIVGETEHPVNKGFRVGNGALRERAAFLLDEAYGNFSGVPVTSLLSLPLANGEVKEGSVQAFVESESSAEDMGPLKFSVPEVHKVGILDVRLFNTDRHAGNILLHKQSPGSATFEMTPIDHGFCLPSYKHLDNANFDWLNWPQAQFPFTCEEIDHIASLDASRDASILRSLSIEEECITTMRICTSLLKAGAEEGFSLFEIGSHLQREGDFSQPSTLEKLVAEAVEKVAVDESDASFADALVEEVERAVVAMFADQQPKKKVRSISCFS